MTYLTRETVLVTGAGGSIGSELCVQIIQDKPKSLIMLDINENALFEIDRQITQEHHCRICIPVISDIRNNKKIRDVFTKYDPTIIFHCAAYKHVPIMETNFLEALENNVIGTRIVAEQAINHSVKRFVFISTDKAVNPINAMGKSKALAEMVIQSMKSEFTHFCIVRFGNVIGSNGSVIPIFKRQIEKGLPITITHKGMMRYFMTISNAVGLVIKAGELGKDGEIFVLDMGEQISIQKLAENMIKESNKEIPIVYIGVRPGEKLKEELFWEQESVINTKYPNIFQANPIPFDKERFLGKLLCIGNAIDLRDDIYTDKVIDAIDNS
jgi:FlaA1/EpsC-like NDP-sugar epimerase